MMIRPVELDRIRRGEIDLAFRRWARPRVRVGTRMRTSVGVLEVTSVEQVAASSLTATDARRAGAASVKALREALAHRQDVPVFRVGLQYAGTDPRDALRDAIPDAVELRTLRAWLDRLDAGAPYGPWTRSTLGLIGRNPGRRAPELAAEVGRETPDFKKDVRKLKEKGLTQSLDIGYLLSPRGAAVLGDPTVVAAARTGTPLPKVGAPASRALTAAGITTLETLAARTEPEVAGLHGVGQFALGRLAEALDAAGMAYADSGAPVRPAPPGSRRPPGGTPRSPARRG